MAGVRQMVERIVLVFGVFSLWIALLPVTVAAQHYEQSNLVSDIPGLATFTDADLVNPWGLSRAPIGPWWVADNGTGKSTIYDGAGTKNATLVVTVPPSTGSAPTGIVFNGSSGFVVTESGRSGPAIFILVTEDGTISGWNPTVDLTNAIITVNNAGTTNYKGVAVATFEGNEYLYVANFTTGQVDVFDSSWHQTSVPGGFVDDDLPEGYVPFNVQEIDGNLFVMYARKGEEEEEGELEEEVGRGLGYVDKFDSGGHLLLRLQHGPWMNAPWGVAKAPVDFGLFSDRILVGQFGSGEIAAFDAGTGEFRGRLHSEKGPLAIEGLWAIAFGANNANSGATNALYFTAGIADETHGLFGTLTPIIKGHAGKSGE